MRIELQSIPAISPTLAETMRNCPLQAALSRIPEIRIFVLGNPKAWLGTAYHEVLENLPSERIVGQSDDEMIRHFWDSAIADLRNRAAEHPLDRRFASPERWPRYHLVRASLQIRARQLLAEMRTVEPPAPAPALALREQQFVGMGGKLIGKPDVVLPQEIRDYKSGSLYEEDADGIEVAKASYLRQLRLYGHLVRENRGYCPPMGRLMAMDGKTVEVELDEHACLAEAKEAIGILDSFNSKLGTAHSVEEVASPSPTSCRWCPFKTICPAFWKNVNPSWIELGSAAIQGTLNADPTAIHNGRAVAIALDAVAGTQTGSVSIAPLDQTIFPHISKFRKGEQVRIVNLRAREDGQVFPTPATVCLRETDCPEFALPSVH